MRSFLGRILKSIEARAAERAAPGGADGRAAAAPSIPAREEFLADAMIERGNALEDGGEVESALAVYRKAVRQFPNYARAHRNVGNALRALRRFDEAHAAYERGRELDPESPSSWLNLGNILLDRGRFAEAEPAYREALRLKPGWGAAWHGLGCALEHSDVAEAERAYREAARLDPPGVLPLGNLAALQKSLGDAVAAADTYRAISDAAPHDLAAHSDLLLSMLYLPDIGTQALLDAHRRFGERFADVPKRSVDAPRGGDRRLRVGFVSADFRAHPVSFFIAPVWRHLDRAQFEVHAYYSHPDSDFITERLRGTVAAWHDVAALDDDALARRIVADGIDILVDLSGHTAGNRLAVFARRPAPVQFTWLGYLATTGLAEIDYRLCDRFTDPPGVAEAWQTETPARMPHSQWCYEPQVDVPAPSQLPRRSRGYWTFGSFNQPSKLGPQVLESWIAVLRAFPDSRLRVVGVTVDPMRDRIRRILESGGVAAERIELMPRLDIHGYFDAYRDVDVALDSFPYNGGTTTCDALLMGVPVAVVEGSRSIARGGVSLLSNLGLEDWIAAAPDDLPALLKRQLDVERIARLRDELPARMRSSPLMDAPAFARDLARVLRDAWRGS